MILYRERLSPPPMLFVALLLVIPASLLIFLPINMFVGIVVAVLLYTGAATMLSVSAPVILVTDVRFSAGSASIPITAVGFASEHRGTDATEQRGPELDARAWLVIRGWVKPVVKVAIADHADPTPYWLISSRRPAEVIAALEEAKQRTQGK